MIESKQPWSMAYYRIRQRCNNPKNISYKNYGGRGIKALIMKDELKILWFRYKAYKMKKPTIDRIDNDGHYEIKNCQFIELEENSRKRRFSKTCPNGHSFSGENLYINKSQGFNNRVCRICAKKSRKKYKEKHKESRGGE